MIKGKQLIDDTLNQEKLNLDHPINDQDAATKDYVDYSFSAENSDSSDVDLIANYVIADEQLATNSAITNQPVVGTYVGVAVNGKSVEIGESLTDAGYFSPDGIFKRTQGAIRKGDNLYWNPSNSFMLDADDIIEFNYLTNANDGSVVQLEDGESIPFNTEVQTNMYDLNGGDGTTSYIVLEGDNTPAPVALMFAFSTTTGTYAIRNDNGNLIFDVGNINGYETIFDTIGQSIEIRTDSNYTVVYDGGDADIQKISIVKKSLQDTIPVLDDLVYLAIRGSDRAVVESFDSSIWTEIDSGGITYSGTSDSIYALSNYYSYSNHPTWCPFISKATGVVTIYNKDGNHIFYKPGVSAVNMSFTFRGNEDQSVMLHSYWGGADVRKRPVNAGFDDTWPKVSTGAWYALMGGSPDAQHLIAGDWLDSNVIISHDYGDTWTQKNLPYVGSNISTTNVSADGQIMTALFSTGYKVVYSTNGGDTWTTLAGTYKRYKTSSTLNTVSVENTAYSSATIHSDTFTGSHTISGTQTSSHINKDGSRVMVADMTSSGDVVLHYSHDFGRSGTWHQKTISSPWSGGTGIYPVWTSPNEHYVYLYGSSNVDDILILDKDTYEVVSLITVPFATYSHKDIKDWHV